MRRAVVVGDRTYLRQPEERDADEFVARARQSRDHLQPFVYTAEEVGSYGLWMERGLLADCEQYLVCARDDDALAGFVTLNNVVHGSLEQATAGWAAFVTHAGRGLMTEGLRLCLDVAFGPLRLRRVEANIQPANVRSRGLALRCGFRLEGYSPAYQQVGGRWCDHERWAVRRDQHPVAP